MQDKIIANILLDQAYSNFLPNKIAPNMEATLIVGVRFY